MTEAQWLSAADFEPMLEFLAARSSQRKFILFGVACCERLGELLTPGDRAALGATEAAADGVAEGYDPVAPSALADTPPVRAFCQEVVYDADDAHDLAAAMAALGR